MSQDTSAVAIGKRWETLAARRLHAEGLRLIARNFRCRGGEIDLIMHDRRVRTLVFVEVRFRRDARFGSAAASVTHRKRERLRHAAAVWLQRHRRYAATPCRFDVLAIDPVPGSKDLRFQWFRGAF